MSRWKHVNGTVRTASGLRKSSSAAERFARALARPHPETADSESSTAQSHPESSTAQSHPESSTAQSSTTEFGPELATVALLRVAKDRLDSTPGPDDEATARIRDRVLRTLAESGHPLGTADDGDPARRPTDTTPAAGPAQSTGPGRSRRLIGPADTRPSARPRGRNAKRDKASGVRGRFAVVVVAVFCLLLALSGMSLLLSRDALPGDPLYGMKRGVENVALGLTFGAEAKADKHLEYAADRVNEIGDLVDRYPDVSNAPNGDYLTALSDFDADASAGSQQLIAVATQAGDGSQLDSLASWSKTQYSKLNTLRPRLPAQVTGKLNHEVALLSAITSRTDALKRRLGCQSVTQGTSDQVGLLPATGQCVRVSDVNPDSATTRSAPNSSGKATQSRTSPPPTTGTPGQPPGRPAQPGTPTPRQGNPTTQLPSPPVEELSTPGGTPRPTAPPTTTTPPTVTIPLPVLPLGGANQLLQQLPKITIG